jgi:hypothetical protein
MTNDEIAKAAVTRRARRRWMFEDLERSHDKLETERMLEAYYARPVLESDRVDDRDDASTGYEKNDPYDRLAVEGGHLAE